MTGEISYLRLGGQPRHLFPDPRKVPFLEQEHDGERQRLEDILVQQRLNIVVAGDEPDPIAVRVLLGEPGFDTEPAAQPEVDARGLEVQPGLVPRFRPRMPLVAVLVIVESDRRILLPQVLDRGIIRFHFDVRPQDIVFGGEDCPPRRAVGRVVGRNAPGRGIPPLALEVRAGVQVFGRDFRGFPAFLLSTIGEDVDAVPVDLVSPSSPFLLLQDVVVHLFGTPPTWIMPVPETPAPGRRLFQQVGARDHLVNRPLADDCLAGVPVRMCIVEDLIAVVRDIPPDRIELVSRPDPREQVIFCLRVVWVLWIWFLEPVLTDVDRQYWSPF